MGLLTACGFAWCTSLGNGASVRISLVAYVGSPKKLAGTDLAVNAGWEPHLVGEDVSERNPQRRARQRYSKMRRANRGCWLLCSISRRQSSSKPRSGRVTLEMNASGTTKARGFQRRPFQGGLG